MNLTEKTLRDYNDRLEEPLKSFIQSISVNSENSSDHRRAQASLKVHLVQEQVAALCRLSNAMEENSRATERSGRMMLWLTTAIAAATIVQALTPYFGK